MSNRYELRAWQCPNQGLPIKSCMGVPVMYGIDKAGIVALQRDTYAPVSHLSAEDFAVIDNEEHRSYKNPTFSVSYYAHSHNPINSFCSWVYVFDTNEILLQHVFGAVLKTVKRGTKGFDVAFSSRDDKAPAFIGETFQAYKERTGEDWHYRLKVNLGDTQGVIAPGNPCLPSESNHGMTPPESVEVKVVLGKVRGFGPDSSPIDEVLAIKEASIDSILKK